MQETSRKENTRSVVCEEVGTKQNKTGSGTTNGPATY
jgi:hypothetical protein